jgi:hypothetical protein
LENFLLALVLLVLVLSSSRELGVLVEKEQARVQTSCILCGRSGLSHPLLV